MSSRENETALWLHNKLGSTDDLWSGRSICSQITKERLQDILGCFRSLQPHVKVKLLLSFLHIVKRNVAEWKVDLDEVIDLAVNDRDQWVSTTGEILKTYPSTFLVNTTDLSGSSTFHSMYSELKKIVRKSGESHTLPLECVCLGKNALSAAVPHIPHSPKHFTLRRKPKSAALRADLLIKSQEIQSSTKKGVPIGSIPMKVRSSAKRMDEEIAMVITPSPTSVRNGGSNAGFLKANTLSSFNSAHRNTSSLAMRKEGGAKMLDISEMPPTGKEAKRRKKLEEQEAAAQAKKEKEEAAAAEKAAAAVQVTPDYAAGLGGTAAIKTGIPRVPRPKAVAASTAPSYLPNITPRLSSANPDYHQPYYQPCYHRYMMSYYNHFSAAHPATHTAGFLAGYPNHSAGYARDLGTSNMVSGAMQTHSTRPVPHTAPIPITANVRLRAPAPVNHQPTRTVTQLTQPVTTQQQNLPAASIAAPQTAVQPTKKPLSLTKEQMVEAQDMFKNSNKVTRPEKALILGFMAGSRDNPCPQQGHIVNIRLSEKIEPVRLQDHSVRDMLSETFFQMNYQTGEWRRIKKFKEPPRSAPPLLT